MKTYVFLVLTLVIGNLVAGCSVSDSGPSEPYVRGHFQARARIQSIKDGTDRPSDEFTATVTRGTAFKNTTRSDIPSGTYVYPWKASVHGGSLSYVMETWFFKDSYGNWKSIER